MNVQEIMSTPAHTCSPRDALDTPARLMWEHDCGVIPVVDAEGGLVGMISDRDICMAAYTQGKPLASIPVEEVMATQVFSCHPGERVEAVERLMGDKQIHRVPVVDGGNRPIGILSLGDIARHASSSSRNDKVREEMVRAMGSICQPRTQRSGARQASSSPAE